MRFIHEIQTGEYGYPRLFKRYTSEIIPALVGVGGGSGTGAMFFEEPGWPEKYNERAHDVRLGRGQLFIHRVTPDGPSFTQEQENFIKCGRITGVDCDGSGRLFIGSWSKSGFKGGTAGYVARVVPKGWKYKAFPNLQKRNSVDLANLLSTPAPRPGFMPNRKSWPGRVGQGGSGSRCGHETGPESQSGRDLYLEATTRNKIPPAPPEVG